MIKLCNAYYEVDACNMVICCMLFSSNVIISLSYINDYYNIANCNNKEITYFIISLLIIPIIALIFGYIIYEYLSNYLQKMYEILDTETNLLNRVQLEKTIENTMIKFRIIFTRLFYVALMIPYIFMLWFISRIYILSKKLHCSTNQKSGINKYLMWIFIYTIYLCACSTYVYIKECKYKKNENDMQTFIDGYYYKELYDNNKKKSNGVKINKKNDVQYQENVQKQDINKYLTTIAF